MSPELGGSCNWGQLDQMSTATGLWSQPVPPGDLAYTEFGTDISEPAPLYPDIASTFDDSLLLSLGEWANSPDFTTNNINNIAASSTLSGPLNPLSTPWSQAETALPQHIKDVMVDESNETDSTGYVWVDMCTDLC